VDGVEDRLAHERAARAEDRLEGPALRAVLVEEAALEAPLGEDELALRVAEGRGEEGRQRVDERREEAVGPGRRQAPRLLSGDWWEDRRAFSSGGGGR
jgi:hypothetical protein